MLLILISDQSQLSLVVFLYKTYLQEWFHRNQAGFDDTERLRNLVHQRLLLWSSLGVSSLDIFIQCKKNILPLLDNFQVSCAVKESELY